MTKKILTYMFLFLAFVGIVTVLVSQGCSSGSNAATTPSTSQSGQPSAQQPGNGQARGPRDPNFIKNVLAKVADKLGVSADSVTQAYQQAQAAVTPPTPPTPGAQGGQTQGTPPGPGQGRPSGSDNRSAYMSAIMNQMSVTLNIPADQISTAWQAAMTELRPSRTSNTPQK
jgi:hypothetical protein